MQFSLYAWELHIVKIGKSAYRRLVLYLYSPTEKLPKDQAEEFARAQQMDNCVVSMSSLLSQVKSKQITLIPSPL